MGLKMPLDASFRLASMHDVQVRVGGSWPPDSNWTEPPGGWVGLRWLEVGVGWPQLDLLAVAGKQQHRRPRARPPTLRALERAGKQLLLACALQPLPPGATQLPGQAALSHAALSSACMQCCLTFPCPRAAANPQCAFQKGQVATARGQTVWLRCTQPLEGSIISVHIK